MVGSNLIFLRPEGAAQRRRRAQDGEQVPGASRTLDNLWKLRMLAREIEIGPEVGSHIREAVRPLMPVVEISRRDNIESVCRCCPRENAHRP